jgi:cytochrome d ubiquinol oxidase subunit II
MQLDLVPIWTLILGLAVFLYVLLDGFDLGVGILYGFASDDHRPKMMSSISPVWDGNETWLVLGGLGLLAAFPLAFAIIIPAVYFPILIMLLALVFRGAAFEFRFRHPALRRFWDLAFCGGSMAATFAQGIVLGSYIQGFQVKERTFSGSSFDWISPFSFLTGFALMFGYGLLGAGWLIFKTEGSLQDWSRRAGRIALAGVLVGIGAVSVWTPFLDPEIARRWFAWPNIAILAPIPIATLTLAAAEWRTLRRGPDIWPFVCAVGLFALSYLGIAISLWPDIVPHRYSLYDAASSPGTQAFLLIGTLFLLPVIFTYTAWSYWVFRGKVRGDQAHY